ncbi:hypothetical protein ACFPTV_08175 [Sinirhodobacter huangdaonensis]|uniref:hypothetical protein n=1 Tax=Paenirhodobacter huangdaonensis TaxID=2501515 RepID=UPI0013E2979D|nr:hypothetical protein [Sinirhodobacter huangdaonensis]
MPMLFRPETFSISEVELLGTDLCCAGGACGHRLGCTVVWGCVLTVVGAQIAITYVPLLPQIFGAAAAPLSDRGLVVGNGVVFLALIGPEKPMRLTFLASKAAAGGT